MRPIIGWSVFRLAVVFRPAMIYIPLCLALCGATSSFERVVTALVGKTMNGPLSVILTMHRLTIMVVRLASVVVNAPHSRVCRVQIAQFVRVKHQGPLS